MSTYAPLSGNPDNAPEKQDAYREKLRGMTDAELRKACNDMIWFSAYASDNPRSRYHWQCDQCHDECVRREKAKIYSEEHARHMKSA